jgi:hypothetical protein
MKLPRNVSGEDLIKGILDSVASHLQMDRQSLIEAMDL